jgi:hypothetical protein
MRTVSTSLGTFTARDDTLADAILAAVDGVDETFEWDVDSLANTYEPVL